MNLRITKRKTVYIMAGLRGLRKTITPTAPRPPPRRLSTSSSRRSSINMTPLERRRPMSVRGSGFSSMPKASVTARIKSFATKKRDNKVARAARRYKGYRKGKKEVRKGKNARAKARRKVELLENEKQGLERKLKLEDDPEQKAQIRREIKKVDGKLKQARIDLNDTETAVKRGKINRDTRALGNKGRGEKRRTANKVAKGGMKALGGLGGAGAALAGMGLLGAGAAAVQS
mmetsp:Transcript_19263/g.33446  ORF Transcript_19263/g.33446 Transcript_19263/m.33446 type:complete len:231 (+) Transcript_19263:1177-1869(+)